MIKHIQSKTTVQAQFSLGGLLVWSESCGRFTRHSNDVHPSCKCTTKASTDWVNNQVDQSAKSKFFFVKQLIRKKSGTLSNIVDNNNNNSNNEDNRAYKKLGTLLNWYNILGGVGESTTTSSSEVLKLARIMYKDFFS